MEDFAWAMFWSILVICITYYNVQELKLKYKRKEKSE